MLPSCTTGRPSARLGSTRKRHRIQLRIRISSCDKPAAELTRRLTVHAARLLHSSSRLQWPVPDQLAPEVSARSIGYRRERIEQNLVALPAIQASDAENRPRMVNAVGLRQGIHLSTPIPTTRTVEIALTRRHSRYKSSSPLTHRQQLRLHARTRECRESSHVDGSNSSGPCTVMVHGGPPKLAGNMATTADVIAKCTCK